MAITGISYGRTFVYEAQKRINAGDVQSAQGSATETAESRFAESIEESAQEDDTVKTPVTRGVQLTRHIEGKDKVPYGEMAEDGVIEYNGVTFVCDYQHNRLTLGDTTNKEDCINIPLSGGGSLLVNRDNIDALSKAIGMFSPEDVKRILEALARDNKIQQMKKELDDMENGDDVDNSEEASETADTDKAVESRKEQGLMTDGADALSAALSDADEVLYYQGYSLDVIARTENAVQAGLVDSNGDPVDNGAILDNAMTAAGFAYADGWYILTSEETAP